MNIKKLDAALNTLTLFIGELREALTEQSGTGEARSAPAPAPDYAPLEPILEEIIPEEGHETICPAHHKPYKEGKFGPFCPEKGIDPAWTNSRGYCTVTPKNAAQYLRVRAAA